jgi:membrane protein
MIAPRAVGAPRRPPIGAPELASERPAVGRPLPSRYDGTMMTTLRAVARLFGCTFTAWWNDNAMRLGAALAYYTVFSLTPFLIVVIAVAGLVIDSASAERQIVEQIALVIGPEGGVAVSGLLESARRPGTGLVATLTSLITILLGATAVFTELQSGLNEIWRVPPASSSAMTLLVRARLRSFALIVGIGFLFLVSLVLRAATAALQDWLGGTIEVTHDVLALLMSTLMFAMIYKVLPETPVAWRDVGVGAAVTALLFTLGQAALGRYLGTSSIASVYGAAGSVVVILVWVYYSAQVFFLGAEFTHAFATTYGSRAGTDIESTSPRSVD